MKRNRLLKRIALLMIAAVFMVSTQFLTAKADLDNPTTVYGFLNAIDKNYGGELNTLTYYGDYTMLLSDWGIGATTYYLQVAGRQEKFYEVLEDGIQSIEFVTTTDALLNDPEEKMIKLFEVAVVQAEESLFSEEDTLALQGFLSRDEIIANAERLIELGKDGRIIASQGPRWGAEIIIRRNDFDIPVGDKFDIHIFRLARNVKFIPEEPVVSVGETQKLNVEIENLTPDAAKVKKLTWLSDNPSILTVDQNGNIKGISKGEAVVSVPIVDNGSPLFSNVKVRVIAGVKKIELAEKKIDLLLCNDEEKGKAKLTYTYEPEDANDPTVKWSSSNEKVATVDEFGNVQAIGIGNAKITATSNGPQNHKKPASAICNVTVKQGVTEIGLSEQSLTLMTGKRARLQVSYIPQNAANKKAVWKSSDETVAKVDGNGNITAVSKGSAMITCMVADDSDVSASCTVNVSDSLPAEDIETVETVQNEQDQAPWNEVSTEPSQSDNATVGSPSSAAKLETEAAEEENEDSTRNIKPNEYYPNGKLKVEYIYNEEGNLSRTNYYNRYGYMTFYEVSVKWDQSGNVLQNETHYSNSTGKYAINYNTMAYDANGNCIRSSYTYADGTPGETYTESQYDSDGRTTARTVYNADGSINGYQVDFVYDQDKHLLSCTDLDADRKIKSTYKAIWSNGNRIEYTHTDSRGKVTWHTVYDPDYEDELTSYYTGEDGTEYTEEYVYHEDSYEEIWCDLTRGSRHLTWYNSERTRTKDEYSQLNPTTDEWVVQSTTEYTVNAAGNTVENRINKDGSKVYIERDENGNSILSRSYAADGTFNYSYASQYNSQGQEIRSESLDENGNLKSYILYEYNSNGNQSKHIWYNADGTFDFGYSYQYDANGNQIRTNKLDENGQTKSYSENTYNSDGLKTREENYDANGQLETYELYEYDENRNLSHTVTYRANGTKSWETKYRTLDDGTQQHKFYSYNNDGTLYKEYDWE